MNSERRVQRVRKAIEAAGASESQDWEIICELARAMGKGEFFDFHSPEEIWEEIRAVWKAGHGITYARLEQGGLQWPCPTEDHPGTTVLHAKSFPSGPRAPLKRIEFHAIARNDFARVSFPTHYRPHALPVQRGHDDHAHAPMPTCVPPTRLTFLRRTRRDSDCATASMCECEAVTAKRFYRSESVRR